MMPRAPKIQALQDKITALSLTFGRNVADGTLKITATQAELDGLPADYIALHKPAANGTYTLTTKRARHAAGDELRQVCRPAPQNVSCVLHSAPIRKMFRC